MVEIIRGVRIPAGFKHWLADEFVRRGAMVIDDMGSMMNFIEYQISRWKVSTIKKWIRLYRKSSSINR